MSVINDMLNDLERRQPQPSQASKDYQGVSAVSRVKHRLHYLWWGLGLITLLVAAWWAWQQATPIIASSHAVPSPVLPVPDLATNRDPTPAKTASPIELQNPLGSDLAQSQLTAAPPIELSRIDLQESPEGVWIDLTFNRPPSTPLLHYRKGDRIWLRLYKAAESSIELPKLAEDGSILDWQSYLETDYQMITLRVAASVEAELIQLDSLQWRLSLLPRSVATKQPKVIDQALPKPKPANHSAKPQQTQQHRSPRAALKKNRNPLKAAEQALAKGRYQRAELLLKGLLAQEPDHLVAGRLLCRLYLQSNRPALVEPVVLTALQHHPDDPELIVYLTRSLLEQERVDEAADYLVSALHQADAIHLGLMAVIRQRQGRHRDASRHFRQALQYRPDELTWLTGLAISQEHLNERASARQIYQRSLVSGELNDALRDFVEQRLQVLNQSE
ncbi:MAG: tetratricopeptide repeat protein [Gammaproteobacteria bacterium]|nr:tetratricopeptide repeat protein [Gammaproteobacteria bacterium]